MFKIFIAAMAVCISLSASQAQEPKQNAQQQTVELDKKETFKFVKAFVQVENFRKSLDSKVLDDKGEIDKSKLEAVNKEFQAKAQEIIEKEGLTLESYSKYIQLLQASPDFQKLVQKIIVSLTQKPAN